MKQRDMAVLRAAVMIHVALWVCLSADAEDNPRRLRDGTSRPSRPVSRDGKPGEPLFPDGTLFGGKMTEEQLKQQTFEVMLRDYERDDEIGRELATKRVDHIFEWRRIARMDSNPAMSVLSQQLRERHPDMVGVSIPDRIRAGDEVTAMFDISYRGLPELPSFNLDEAGRRARTEEIRNELLEAQRVAWALERAASGPPPQDRPAMVRHIRKNLQIRIDFEPYREIVTVAMDDPMQMEASVVHRLVTDYLSGKHRDQAASRTRTALADMEASIAKTASPEHRARMQQVLERRRELYNQRFSDAQPIDSDLMYLELHTFWESYDKRVIERAQREFGRDFERKANRR